MEVRLEKVTLNIGVGEGGAKLENAKALLERITQSKPATTTAKTRNPTWKLKKGDPIGAKVTLRGAKAADVLSKALQTIDGKLQKRVFDNSGNFSFGVKEYIDYPGAKYDPKIGMMGFDVSATLEKKGARLARRRIGRKKLPAKQRVKKEEAMEFATKNFGVTIEEEISE